MALEQTIKELQAQNTQFQAMIASLTKGQEEMKALLTKKEKKGKKKISFINMGRRFKRSVKEAVIPEDANNQESEHEENSDHDTDEIPEQEDNYHYDSADDDKYKSLEDRLSAMEVQRIPGLDFEDLGLVPGVVIPPKFKVPTFVRYDGVSCPKLHLRSYAQKIQAHTTDKKLWMHFFQESLSGTQLEWYYQLESANIRTWSDLAEAFYRQYQYNSDLAPTRTQLQSMSMGSGESFKGYAQKWRDLVGRVQPPLSDREMVDMFMGTLTGPFFKHLLGSSSAGFTELILIGERVESGIRSGKIQVAASSSKYFGGNKKKNEVNMVSKG